MTKTRLLHHACSNDGTAFVSHTLAMSSMWFNWQRAVWSSCKNDQITVHVITTIITVMHNKNNEYLLMYIEIQSTAPPADLLRKVNSVESWDVGHKRILRTSVVRLSSLDATLLTRERERETSGAVVCLENWERVFTSVKTDWRRSTAMEWQSVKCCWQQKDATSWGPGEMAHIGSGLCPVVNCKSLMMMTMKCQETESILLNLLE